MVSKVHLCKTNIEHRAASSSIEHTHISLFEYNPRLLSGQDRQQTNDSDTSCQLNHSVSWREGDGGGRLHWGYEQVGDVWMRGVVKDVDLARELLAPLVVFGHERHHLDGNHLLRSFLHRSIHDSVGTV